MKVFVFPLTCQCDSARWVAATHRVVIDTLHIVGEFNQGKNNHNPTLPLNYTCNYN